ncbi:hypothetical protein DACRYDRAFT_119383 [Dacryopinax primogenitus]|uniref:Uncharacterized protein n=1 Tax=Dacryopinax primogenitus (strain DJM 731) TaxID=1858805 RepID=M5G1V6_DACPD|nr:uncharacterized protein DACRYDRAFT_119383 [Dacryopinax primogenitus]EJT97727.1 hypothetical protein DACRYDRAFT_119383 [Dacryopinax primogenitus]
MSPFTFSAGTITPHRLRKRSTSPKEPRQRVRQSETPSGIPRLRRQESTPSIERVDTSSPTKTTRAQTPVSTRVKRPSTAPCQPPSSQQPEAADSLLSPSTSLPTFDTLDSATLSQLEQLSLELLALTASTASTPPRRKNILTRSPRLDNIVEVDTPQSDRGGVVMHGTPCAMETRTAEDVWREVGRLGRELKELAW